jgi:dihydrodipicolinate synthase/N-acetylneuraminate lyase
VQFLVATVTPFDGRGKVDLERLRAHVLWLASQGVDGFVPTGTTGEFLYLSDREREAIHRVVMDAAGALPVYPCTWDPSPSTMAFLSEAARDSGASGLLLPPPLYYAGDDRMIEAWYTGVAEKARIPILAYHHPGHIKATISPALYEKLRKNDVLAGLKDSSGDIFRLKRFGAQDPGAVYAGGDMILGAARNVPQLAGFISALGNVWPSLCLRLYRDGEQQLESAVIERANRVRRAGGLRAMKALLRMGHRAPMIAPEHGSLEGLPPAEI